MICQLSRRPLRTRKLPAHFRILLATCAQHIVDLHLDVLSTSTHDTSHQLLSKARIRENRSRPDAMVPMSIGFTSVLTAGHQILNEQESRVALFHSLACSLFRCHCSCRVGVCSDGMCEKSTNLTAHQSWTKQQFLVPETRWSKNGQHSTMYKKCFRRWVSSSSNISVSRGVFSIPCASRWFWMQGSSG